MVCSAFFCYAGSASYAHHYRYSWTSDLLRWYPTPIGVFRQGSMGLGMRESRSVQCRMVCESLEETTEIA